MTAPRVASMPQLRDLVRRLSDEHGLTTAQRARLVLAVTTVAEPALAAGTPVRLDAHRRARDTQQSLTTTVTVTLRACSLWSWATPPTLPLAPDPGTANSVVWHVPIPLGPTIASRGGDADEEVAAVVAEADLARGQLRDLKNKLAETNRGVLAMYAQLEHQKEQLRAAHTTIFHELEDALRPPPPSVPDIELGARSKPAEIDAPVGGDLYDWFVLPDSTLHITIVDAVGHGITSTRTTLNVTHTVRTLALEGHPIGDLVARTAATVALTRPADMATVLLARLDPRTGTLLLANGGHPPALLAPAHYLEIPGRGIGFPNPGSVRLHRDQLRPGDLLLLYTDGLTESRKDLLAGERRLLDLAGRVRGTETRQLPTVLLDQMHDVVLHPDDTLLLRRALPTPNLTTERFSDVCSGARSGAEIHHE
ncbi:PP2C family protein-serine/threonine phosphatase [Amycolatopsis sp. CA-230715]|uniref:PP2C family protein-serine/threonine phosphatase n=1 Tax=Amycolatopsis sp. CA-230715 TaxID=2745196 RepID=UPI001C341E47|nr:PP2C family protein-serine/threonine phosphatase [Amycolatopsis sp. CA-230715]QWF81103.1 hypothetical protein HUW46_04529 [Amycolatopsis sp. CA-230715]